MSSLERLMLDNSEQMVLLVEPGSLRIVVANAVAVNNLGYSEEELLAKTILDVECSLQDVFYWEEVSAANTRTSSYRKASICVPTARCARSASRSNWSNRKAGAGC